MARRKERTTTLDPTRPKHGKKLISFDEATELYLANVFIKGQSVETIRWNKENLSALKKVLVEEKRDTTPGRITEEILKNNFILQQIKRGLKPNTINGRIRSCKGFFSFLYKEGYIKIDPAKNLEKVKSEKPIIEAFTRGQFKQLLSVIDKNTFVGFRDYVMILLILETGMRVSEVARFKIEDILFEEGVIRIPYGKGAKGRMVPFQLSFKRLLRKYLKERGDLYHSNVFITIDEEPIPKRNIQERIAFYGKKANLKGVRCSAHTIRHTFAKFYVMSGGDIFSLQKILGHSSLDMVRHYVELFGNEIREQHSKFSPLKGLNLDDEE